VIELVVKKPATTVFRNGGWGGNRPRPFGSIPSLKAVGEGVTPANPSVTTSKAVQDWIF
jgi:hypothetical protein